MNPTTPPPRSQILMAFTAVYLVWGSTYLAIRVAVATMPPFLLGGARFVLAGLVLLPLLHRRGDAWPTARQWKNAAIAGVLLMLGGNGLVVWAEKTVTSSQTALFIATTPVWFAVFDWLRPGGTRPRVVVWIGVFLGFAGVVTLVSDRTVGSPVFPVSSGVALCGATMCWAAGSLFTRHSDRPHSPLMGAAAQMLCGGLAMLFVGLVRGEAVGWDTAQVSAHSLLAFAYLVVFGSLIGYTAYVFLLRHCQPAQVSTYAYVNPLIAVLLGGWLLDEPLGPRLRWAGVLIIVGVAILSVPPATWGRLVARGLPFKPLRS